MRSLVLSAVAAALAACASQPAASTPPLPAGDAALGRVYAEQACAACHAVAPGEEFSPHPQAPAFAELANTPGMTHRALDVWLHSAHPSMPHLIVEQERIEDLSAYLATLRREN